MAGHPQHHQLYPLPSHFPFVPDSRKDQSKGGKGRPSPPDWQGGPLNQIDQTAGAKPSLWRASPQMGNKAGTLLPKAPSASVVPASRLRAAVPIWTNPTVSGSLGGLPLTDARMPALEPRGTKRNVGECRASCLTAQVKVYLYQLSQDYSPPKPFFSWFTGPVLSASSTGPISNR